MLGVSFALAAPAGAGTVTVTFGPYQASPPGGGEFTLTPDGWLDLSSYSQLMKTGNPSLGDIISFQTFCIEHSEFINQTTYNGVLNTNAMDGGVGPLGDPISKGTGWLYSQFASGVLSGYDYLLTDIERRASAAKLQEAIWMLEGEQAFASNSFITLLLQQPAFFNDLAAAKADGGAAYGVSAINLTNLSGGLAQDQLYFHSVPDGGMTLMLLGMTLSGLAALPRRFRKD